MGFWRSITQGIECDVLVVWQHTRTIGHKTLHKLLQGTTMRGVDTANNNEHDCVGCFKWAYAPTLELDMGADCVPSQRRLF